MKVLGIIPARGGSKGLPRKNIKTICGKPLIEWTINSAKASNVISDIFISTDDEEIAEIVRSLGMEVPFLRPKKFAQDDSSTFDVIKHVLDSYSNDFDYIILLEPTSPMRTADDIDNAFNLLLKYKHKSIVGIAKIESQHPSFSVWKNIDGTIKSVIDMAGKAVRRQEVDDIYYYEGSLYISEVREYLRRKTFYHESTMGFVMPKYKSLEIDDLDDFIMTESLMRYYGYK